MTIKPHSNIIHAGMQDRIVVIRESLEEQVFIHVKDADFKHFKLLPMYNWISENGISIGEVPFKKGALVCIIGFEAGYISTNEVFVSVDFVSGDKVEKVDFKIIEFMAGIEISEKSLNFGTLKIGQAFDHNIELKNTGEYEVQALSFNCNIHGCVIFGSFQPFVIAPGKSVTKTVTVNIISGIDPLKSALCVNYRAGGIDITSKFKMNIEVEGYDNSDLPFSISVLPVKINGQARTPVKEISDFVGDCLKIGKIDTPELITAQIKINAVSDRAISVLGATITGGELISVVSRPDAQPFEIGGYDSKTIKFSFIPNKIKGINSVKVSFLLVYGEEKKDFVLDIIWGVSEN
jgi:hypothetical protein